MVATFIVEEIATTGRRVSKRLSNGIKQVGGESVVARGLDKVQSGTINLGIRISTAVVPRGLKFWHFAKVELRPPRMSEMSQVTKGLQDIMSGARSGKWKTVTTKEALVNTCVTAEVLMWFFVGECFGKGHLVGYQYPGAVWMELEL